MLKVNRLESFTYEVTGEGIQAIVTYYDKYDTKVKGKGSRTHKEEIISAVKTFLSDESKQKEIVAQQEKDNFQATLNENNIDLTGLYNVTVNKDESYYGYGLVKSQTILTGIELLNEYDAIAYEPITINNTDIYYIEVNSRRILSDERMIQLNNSVVVTGLALKELLLTGLKSYGKIRKAYETAITMLKQLGNKNKTSFMIGAKFDISKELEMATRYEKEMERATKATNEVTLPNETTPEGKEIKYAWFSSKVFNIDELKNKRMATLEKYVVAESITVNKETFEQFSITFDMKDLNTTFKGGSSSSYEPVEDTEDFYKLSESEQAKWIKGAYNLALEVKIERENFSLLIDPQGYDYARYTAIIENEAPEQPTKEIIEEVESKIIETTEQEIAIPSVTLKVELNEKKKGIELYFSSKPSQTIIKLLKSVGFYWNGKKYCWCAVQMPERFEVVEKVKGLLNEINSNLERVTKEVMEQVNEPVKENIVKGNIIDFASYRKRKLA
jgi:hypothetical protein